MDGRTGELSRQMNLFWNKFLKTDGIDYYSRFKIDDFIELKKAISNVNNIVTLQVTKLFADFLVEKRVINMNQRTKLLMEVEATKANTNGFDVEFSDSEINVVAEVKCNIPVGHKSFGAAQQKGIEHDLDALWQGKSTSKICVKDCNKFMVMLDVENVRISMQKIIDGFNISHCKNIVENYHECGKLSNDKIYVVYISKNLICEDCK